MQQIDVDGQKILVDHFGDKQRIFAKCISGGSDIAYYLRPEGGSGAADHGVFIRKYVRIGA